MLHFYKLHFYKHSSPPDSGNDCFLTQSQNVWFMQLAKFPKDDIVLEIKCNPQARVKCLIKVHCSIMLCKFPWWGSPYYNAWPRKLAVDIGSTWPLVVHKPLLNPISFWWDQRELGVGLYLVFDLSLMTYSSAARYGSRLLGIREKTGKMWIPVRESGNFIWGQEILQCSAKFSERTLFPSVFLLHQSRLKHSANNICIWDRRMTES